MSGPALRPYVARIELTISAYDIEDAREELARITCDELVNGLRDAVSDLVKAFAEQTGKTTTAIRSVLKAKADSKESEMRDDLQGRLELLGGGE